METLRICLIQFLNGFKDSIIGCFKFIRKQHALNKQQQLKHQQMTSSMTKRSSSSMTSSTVSKALQKDEKLYQRILQSCVLNGLFLLACILAFNYILMPLLDWIAFMLTSEHSHSLITDYFNPSIWLIFSFVWILPVFIISKIFNLLWHQEIADIAYEKKYGKPAIFKNARLADVIADTIFSCIMELIFLVQSSLMIFVPATLLSKFLCHLHLAFLYSLYAFEYKFVNAGWDIKKRIAHIESRWPYYVGFGLSLSLILSIADSYIYNATLFASLFPAFILSAIEADSEKLQPIIYTKFDPAYVTGCRIIELKVPLFRFAILATDYFFKIFSYRKSLKNAPVSSSSTNPAAARTANFVIRKTN